MVIISNITYIFVYQYSFNEVIQSLIVEIISEQRSYLTRETRELSKCKTVVAQKFNEEESSQMFVIRHAELKKVTV